ncbi:3'(2'),5'-bisphosphate nucleotidase CysQ [Pseudoruegeria sp. SK021]|uniref:3'(2'),5'-bisphosphate nucleotidase CysQ n=1 Tax=Pseudoruegeria sp. SK021 TaxID=1933035 RepID=UPI000A252517|nr:3'(2'),5'-bisphosphate nucleotidase CysQ [Pseudoruegeria sp. SK021]OSP55069.1 3'(2'),5'-bisphosphate nucleotidase CysQ [Pseudoruegeria sp. SK021]
MPEPEATADLALLTTAALAAGRLATPFYHGDAQVWDKPDQAGPVTEADLAVDAMLNQTLRAARPDYGWLSEETPDTPDRLTRSHVFIVDPIDGTRAFVEGDETWSHSLAVARDGQITAAVVYLPLKDRLYTAALGGGAHLNGVPLRASRRADPVGATLLANKWSMEPRYWPGGPPQIKRHFRSSLAYRLALIGEGRFDAMVTFRDTWEWDIAAGSLIAQEAGATVTNRTAGPLSFNQPAPLSAGVVAAGPDLHAGLIARHR